MPTCSQITDALNTLASATTNPNILSDLSGQTASLTSPLDSTGSHPSQVELSTGGPAVLTVPSSVSISGKAFQITVCYDVSPTTVEGPENNFQLFLSIGNPFSGGNQISAQALVFSAATPGGGFVTFVGVWDSVTQNLLGYLNESSIPVNNGSALFTPFAVASQSDLQFSLWTNTDGTTTDPQNVLNITQFKLELI